VTSRPFLQIKDSKGILLTSFNIITSINKFDNLNKKKKPLSKKKGIRRHGAATPRGQHQLLPKATVAVQEKTWTRAEEEMTPAFHRTSREAPV